GARKDAHPDRVHAFLDRRPGHFLGQPVQAGVDHLEAGVAERPRHHFDAAVVAVEPHFGHQDPDPSPRHREPAQNTGSSTYVPNTARKALTISPAVAYALTASIVGGMRLSSLRATSASSARHRST